MPPPRLPVFLLFAIGLTLFRTADGAVPLTRIADVRSLPREEAAKALPVHVRGVVTWMTPRDGFAMQDDSGGIRVQIFVARDRQLWSGDDALLAGIPRGPGAHAHVVGGA